MLEPELLLAALKAMLKERRVAYADLADALEVSLLTVKRTLNKRAVPLDRLLEICRIAKIDFAELVERAASLQPEHTYFTAGQDTLFDDCPPTLAYFEELQAGRTPSEIAERFKLTAASTMRYLSALSAVGLVDVSGRGLRAIVELRVTPPMGFAPGSKTLARKSAAFLQSVVERVVAVTDRRDSDFALLKPMRLSERQYSELRAELLAVVNRFAFLSESSSDIERPFWQLAIASSDGGPTAEPLDRIRNLEPEEAKVGVADE